MIFENFAFSFWLLAFGPILWAQADRSKLRVKFAVTVLPGMAMDVCAGRIKLKAKG